ncbi:MAG: helix-turn-helix domain-containing protein, partial [Eubacteriales bacterium]
LSIGAKAVYAYFCSFTGAGDSCFPSREKICYDLKITKDTLSKYIRSLRDCGYIEVEQSKEGVKFSRNIYTMCDMVPSCPKFSDTKFSDTKFSDTKNLDTINNSIKNNSFKINTMGGSKLPEPAPEKADEEKKYYGKNANVRLTDEEFERLKTEHPSLYAEYIERLSKHIKKYGKKYVDHYFVIEDWIAEDSAKEDQTMSTSSFDTDSFFAAALAHAADNDVPPWLEGG